MWVQVHECGGWGAQPADPQALPSSPCSSHALLSLVELPLGPHGAGAVTCRMPVPEMGSWSSCTTRQVNLKPLFSSPACTVTVLFSSNKPREVSVGCVLLPVFISVPFSSQLTVTAPG